MATSLAAAKRLRKELQVLRRDQDENDTIKLQHNPDNLLTWTAWIKGPVDTPYEGGVFQLDIRCGVDYPLAPPTIKFVTKVSIARAQISGKTFIFYEYFLRSPFFLNIKNADLSS